MTTYTGPTPWDVPLRLALERCDINPIGENIVEVHTLTAKAEGYRRAKAEDAPLLEALKIVRECMVCTPPGGMLKVMVSIVTNAIAVAEGRV